MVGESLKHLKEMLLACVLDHFFDELASKYPVKLLHASEEKAGLPRGAFGNSEVGHLNLGAGRVVYQDLLMVNKAISDKSF